jgi:hypothetical protein
LRQVEKFLGEPVVGFIPSDYQTAVNSINLGTRWFNRMRPAKSHWKFRRIAQTLSTGVMPVEEPKARRAFWSSFLKRQPAQPKFELQTSLEKV